MKKRPRGPGSRSARNRAVEGRKARRRCINTGTVVSFESVVEELKRSRQLTNEVRKHIKSLLQGATLTRAQRRTLEAHLVQKAKSSKK